MALYERGIRWRVKRQAHPKAVFWAVFDLSLLAVAVALIAWGL